MKIIFFGTPQFAAEVLSFLINQAVEIIAVVTGPDRAKGRSAQPVFSPVKQVAIEKVSHLPIYQPERASTPEFERTLASLEADLFVVVAYGQLLKQNILDLPKLGCINLHASLLPKYRGAAPIQRSIIEGESETGVTIMQMVLAMDAGDMLRSAHISIGDSMTFGELEKKLCELGKVELLKTIQDYASGQVYATPQDHSKATFAPKIELENTQIFWGNSAAVLYNLIRGVTPLPGAWSLIKVRGQLKRLKILAVEIRKNLNNLSPGTIFSSEKERLIIACGEDALELLEVQLEGKRGMSTREFMKGYSSEQLDFQV